MIETKYRSYTITFNEDAEEWSCSDLAISGLPKLSAVKRKIDDISKRERRVNVRALHARSRIADAEAVEVTVTVLCEPEPCYGDKSPTVKSCWAKNAAGERVKLNLSDVIPIEHRADLETWVRLDTEAQAAVKRAHQHLEAIPRHDADSLMLAAKEAAADDNQ